MQRLQQDDAALTAAVLEDLRAALGVTGEPRWTRLIRWDAATPQYEKGHAAVVRAIDAATAITIKVNTWPAWAEAEVAASARPKATSARSTAFSMSSRDISTTRMLRRARTP